jgi:hypothetical protein
MTTQKVLLVKSLDRIKNMGGEVHAIPRLDDIHCSEDGFFDLQDCLGPIFEQLQHFAKEEKLEAPKDRRKWTRVAKELVSTAIPAEEKRGELSVSAEVLATLAGMTLARLKAKADKKIWQERALTTMARVTTPDLQYAYAPLTCTIDPVCMPGCRICADVSYGSRMRPPTRRRHSSPEQPMPCTSSASNSCCEAHRNGEAHC